MNSRLLCIRRHHSTSALLEATTTLMQRCSANKTLMHVKPPELSRCFPTCGGCHHVAADAGEEDVGPGGHEGLDKLQQREGMAAEGWCDGEGKEGEQLRV